MIIKQYLYITPKKEIILIRAKRKPSFDTQPISSTWVVREWDEFEIEAKDEKEAFKKASKKMRADGFYNNCEIDNVEEI